VSAFAGTDKGKLDGHGVLVTNIAGGDTYGIARKSTIRVSALASTNTSQALSAINTCKAMEAILKERDQLKGEDAEKPAVLNCSWGDYVGNEEQTQEEQNKASEDLVVALTEVQKKGIIIVAAAGNDKVCDLHLRNFPFLELRSP
jgi:Subtilase family